MTSSEIAKECEIAISFSVASVCAKPHHLRAVVQELAGSDVRPGVAIAFPHGGTTTDVKAFESGWAVDLGALELDMVINIDALCSGEFGYVEQDIRAVVRAGSGALVKVIIETAYLTDFQKVEACKIAESAGANFVKTSTGFAPAGATLEDVRLMKQTVGSHVLVKAAGGIRTLGSMLAMIEAGASRIGATATASILTDFANKDKPAQPLH